MSIESDVQLNPEGSGPRVRTLQIDERQDTDNDGAPDTRYAVQQQVVTLADRLGRLIEDDSAWREEVLEQMKLQTEQLTLIADALGPH